MISPTQHVYNIKQHFCQDIMKFTGNAMSVPVIGAVLASVLQALVCVPELQMQAPPAIQEESPRLNKCRLALKRRLAEETLWFVSMNMPTCVSVCQTDVL